MRLISSPRLAAPCNATHYIATHHHTAPLRASPLNSTISKGPNDMRVDKSLASVIPVSALGGGEAELRGSGIMWGYHFSGPSADSTSPTERAAVSRGLAAAFLHLSGGDLIQCQWHRVPAELPKLRQYPTEAARLVAEELHNRQLWRTSAYLYLTHRFDDPIRGYIRAALLSENVKQNRLEMERQYARQRFKAFEDACPVPLRRMTDEEMWWDWDLTINGHDRQLALPDDDVRLNEVIAAERQINGRKPQIGRWHYRPVVVTLYRSKTTPQMLAAILRHPGHMTVSARFIINDAHDSRHRLETKKSYYEMQRWFKLRNIIGRIRHGIHFQPVSDEDTKRQLAELEHAIATTHQYEVVGWVTVTCIIKDEDPDRADMRARDLVKDLSALNMIARVEDVHAPAAIYATYPGNGYHNVRRPEIRAINFADLVLPCEHWTGTPTVDSEMYEDEPTVLVTGGTGNEPFYWPSHIGGVPHQLWIGSTGSGKSTPLAVLAALYTGIKNSRIHLLDVGLSSYVFAHLIGATYYNVGTKGGLPLNPMAVLNDEDGKEWLYQFFTRLFQKWGVTLTASQDEELSSQLSYANYKQIRSMLGFREVITDRTMKRILRNYCEMGYWGHIFDVGWDDKQIDTDTQVTVYELQELRTMGPRAAGPATELILHRILRSMKGDPTWVLFDEFHSFLAGEETALFLDYAIRELRRKNGCFVGATQSIAEIVQSPNHDLWLESCAGKIYLPNPQVRSLDAQYAREQYYKLGLSEHQVTTLGRARSRHSYYYTSPAGSRLFSMDLRGVAKAICGSTSHRDIKAFRGLQKECKPHELLDRWLGERCPMSSLSPA